MCGKGFRARGRVCFSAWFLTVGGLFSVDGVYLLAFGFFSGVCSGVLCERLL